MREPYERDIKKEILEACFMYLVKKGLESASINNLCAETGISSGSIYYWFTGRDEVILDSAEYGVSMILQKMFELALSNINNIREFLNELPTELVKYKKELRFIYQVTTSEQYGQRMRCKSNELKKSYDLYSDKLAEQLSVNIDKLKPFVYLTVSSVLNYIVWENYEIMQKELDYIYDEIKKMR